jgi:competence protein ComGC
MNLRALPSVRRSAAFTMVEIAICLAIIGLALVAIIGVLPLGMKCSGTTARRR